MAASAMPTPGCKREGTAGAAVGGGGERGGVPVISTGTYIAGGAGEVARVMGGVLAFEEGRLDMADVTGGGETSDGQ